MSTWVWIVIVVAAFVGGFIAGVRACEAFIVSGRGWFR